MTNYNPTHSVHSYLASLEKELLRGDATEHTHRSALKALLESAAPGLLATNEPKAIQRENKPDYIVRKGVSVMGFVEAKDVDKSLKTTLKTNQIKRYLEALPNLLLTNYPIHRGKPCNRPCPNCCWCHATRPMRRSTSGAGR